jgi:hypothetical protein
MNDAACQFELIRRLGPGVDGLWRSCAMWRSNVKPPTRRRRPVFVACERRRHEEPSAAEWASRPA